MSKLKIITLHKLCQIQAQAVQEKKTRTGCNIQSIKIIQDILVLTICHIKIMIHIREFTVINILG